MMDVVDFAVKVTAAVLRRLADGIDTAEKPTPASPPVHMNFYVASAEETLEKLREHFEELSDPSQDPLRKKRLWRR